MARPLPDAAANPPLAAPPPALAFQPRASQAHTSQPHTSHPLAPPAHTPPPHAQAPARLTTVAEAIRNTAARLLPVADNPRLEARLLLAHALGVEPADLIRDPRQTVDATVLDGLIARREAREPVALIRGRREFWSMDLLVSPATLIPRPDSETIVQAALAACAGRLPPQRILDLGTGTGCLLLALLHEFPSAFGVGVDISDAAAALARRNASRLGLAGRSAFVCGDWTNSLDGTFALIVANPPYIAEAEIGGLMAEVARYEPHRALNGGPDGLDAYRAILPRLRRTLAADGVAVLEVGAQQAGLVASQAQGHGFAASIRPDLAGIDRAVVLTLEIDKKCLAR